MAIRDFKSQRIFVNTDLVSGGKFECSREQANYLLNVLRLGNGAEILAFNGRDGEWQCEIQASGRKKCALLPVECIQKQPEPATLVYCFSPLKQARLDYMIQKAVEMGAGVLQPVITEYTQVRSVNEKRVFANAVEAAEQCGLLGLPEIRTPLDIRQIEEILDADTVLIFCDEDAAQSNDLDRLGKQDDRKLIVLIGPEGGFSPQERVFLKSLPNVFVLGLGPRILRADTAAVAALAVIQARLGDWYP